LRFATKGIAPGRRSARCLSTIWRTGRLGIEGKSVPPRRGVMFAVEAATSTRAHNAGGTNVPDGIRWVGLDVHARGSTIAVFDQATGEVATKRVVGRPHELLPLLRAVERPARMVYEAGPTGYGLARRALAEGIELGVCARARPSVRRTGSRPISVTRSAWRGCWPPASSCWSRSRLWSVSSCAIWSSRSRTARALPGLEGGPCDRPCHARGLRAVRGGNDRNVRSSARELRLTPQGIGPSWRPAEHLASQLAGTCRACEADGRLLGHASAG
jgi:hypothetical protein